MDNTEIETTQDSTKQNTVLLYTATALAVVGAAVVVTKTIRYASAVATVVKQKRAEKQIESAEAPTLTVAS
jgi:hypothetical protein